MFKFISKIFGGSKSEKDVQRITPLISKINEHFASYQQLTNDQLRGKTAEFRQRIAEHLKPYICIQPEERLFPISMSLFLA